MASPQSGTSWSPGVGVGDPDEGKVPGGRGTPLWFYFPWSPRKPQNRLLEKLA